MIGTDLKLDRGGQRYEAPAVDVLEIRGEGVLCQSGNFGIGDWEEDNDPLNA